MLNGFPVLNRIVESFAKLPGVGEKTALKYALWFVEHKDESLNLSKNLDILNNDVKSCSKCRCITVNKDGVCDICKDETRDKSTICVVENMENFFAIESSSVYNGLYYILGGFNSSLYGVDTEKTGLKHLIGRVFDEDIREVILVISSTIEGDFTTQYIKEKLKDKGVNITRIAYGIPIGVNVNFIDKTTLIEAFKSRRAV